MATPQQVIEALAFTAFKLHYDATKRPGWQTAEAHWRAQPVARDLWAGITAGIIQGAQTAASMAAGKPIPGAPLPGLGSPLPPLKPSALATRGPVTPLPSAGELTSTPPAEHPHNLGQVAGLRKQPRNSNPYTGGTLQYKQWETGWLVGVGGTDPSSPLAKD